MPMAKSWETVDAYARELVVGPDPSYREVYEASLAAGLPDIAISPAEGKQLQILAQMCGAKRILEIGTLGGYSSLWLARALPSGGSLTTLEYDPHHAATARANLTKAGVADRVTVMVGAALDLLPRLAGPFDFVFIDANKDGYPDYFRWAVKLAQPGTVIVADNVVRDGKVADAHSSDPLVRGVRAMLDVVAATPNVSASVIQTVGVKGYDGYLIARVTA
jgi:predicted O-methyltransferase YrrM